MVDGVRQCPDVEVLRRSEQRGPTRQGEGEGRGGGVRCGRSARGRRPSTARAGERRPILLPSASSRTDCLRPPAPSLATTKVAGLDEGRGTLSVRERHGDLLRSRSDCRRGWPSLGGARCSWLACAQQQRQPRGRCEDANPTSRRVAGAHQPPLPSSGKLPTSFSSLLMASFSPNGQRGLFIVLEGLDRSGKSTQCELLLDRLREATSAAEPWKFPGASLGRS